MKLFSIVRKKQFKNAMNDGLKESSALAKVKRKKLKNQRNSAVQIFFNYPNSTIKNNNTINKIKL